VGGLTEVLALAAEAKRRGLRIMVGGVISTSLGIAPALLIAQQAEIVDLDGPLHLALDRGAGLRYATAARSVRLFRSCGADLVDSAA
jgi:L-alanine-DL-glutamate epimerase-like enolase superfamily enzyme